MLGLLPPMMKQSLSLREFIKEMVEVSSYKTRALCTRVNTINNMRKESIVLFSGLKASTLKGITVEGTSLEPLVPKLEPGNMTPLLVDYFIWPRMHEVAPWCACQKPDSPLLPPNRKVRLGD